MVRFVWRRRGLWLRALIGWIIGVGLLTIDQQSDFDLRLRLRGKQPVDSSIVVLPIDHDTWRLWRHSFNDTVPSDNEYWDPQAWQEIFSRLLKEHPLAIAVTTYFGPNLPDNGNVYRESPIFSDRRIIWASQLTEEGHVLPSPFASKYGQNSGVIDFTLDRDGIVRRFGHISLRIPHLAVQTARRLGHIEPKDIGYLKDHQPVINYRGEAGTFTHISLADFLSHRYPKRFFSKKIVLIGTPDLEGSELHTPVGKMAKTEIIANLIDNMHYHRWIKSPPFILLVLLVMVLVLLSALLTSRYPQFLAFFILVWLNVFYTTFSLWMFDSHYIWLPVLAPVTASFGTYVIFLSFQLTLKEYVTQQLEKEHQFLLDVEQLKNNFLSLISHDLRTPIAKIQAICDRLLAENPQSGVAPDLSSLREIATELNRYITTIIQITRVESKDFQINKDSVDINELIERATKNLEPLARQKRIGIETLLEPMFLIEVDSVLIYEVVLNLVENAIKYTPEGGQVRVSSQEVDGKVIVMVEDNGVGIPETEQAHVFEKFYRGEKGKSHPRGSGLGLYLVKYFIEIHGGQIFLESQPGVGTKVGFSLPVEETQTEADSTDTTPATVALKET